MTFDASLGEVPGEGWQAYLQEEERRLLAARYQCSRPPTPIDPSIDADAYLDWLVAKAPGDTSVTQLQVDWDRFVTFGEQLEAVNQKAARSRTPSPILPALNRPMGWPMTRQPSREEARIVPPPYATRQRSRSRARLRQDIRNRLQTESLRTTHQGRAILAMASRRWYVAPSGFAVTQYAPEGSVWRANDEANYLHWLDRDIRVHRSTTHQLLCVENIEALNAVLNEHGIGPIELRPPPSDWQARWGGVPGAARNLPSFLRAGYSRRKELGRYVYRALSNTHAPVMRCNDDADTDCADPLNPTQADAQDAGQAAHRSSRPRAPST